MKYQEENFAYLEMNYKAYELYVKRVMHEGNHIWSQFKIYLSLNVGAVAVIAFLLKEFMNELHKAPPWVWLIVFGVTIIGRYLSTAWTSINIDGARWQLFINKRLSALEKTIPSKEITLYSDIMDEYYQTMNDKEDVIDTNVRLAEVFTKLWVTLSVISIVAAVVSGAAYVKII